MIKPHKKLNVWQLAMDIVEDVYNLTETFPAHERFGLTSQLRRCAVSVPSNIAEGMEKESAKEQVRFIEVAKGSTAEFATQTYIGMDIGYIKMSDGKTWLEKSNHILSMLSNLQKTIKHRNT